MNYPNGLGEWIQGNTSYGDVKDRVAAGVALLLPAGDGVPVTADWFDLGLAAVYWDKTNKRVLFFDPVSKVWIDPSGTGVTSIVAVAPIKEDRIGNRVQISHLASGVTVGTYERVTVDGFGHVTSASKLTAADIQAILGYVPWYSGNVSAGNMIDIQGNQISFKPGGTSGDIVLGDGTLAPFSAKGVTTVQGTLPIKVTQANGVATISHNTSGVTAGTFTKVTVDANGHVTSATLLTSTDVANALGYTPYNPANYPVNAGGETLASVLVRGKVARDNIQLGDSTDSLERFLNMFRLDSGTLYNFKLSVNSTLAGQMGAWLSLVTTGTNPSSQGIGLLATSIAPIYYNNGSHLMLYQGLLTGADGITVSDNASGSVINGQNINQVLTKGNVALMQLVMGAAGNTNTYPVTWLRNMNSANYGGSVQMFNQGTLYGLILNSQNVTSGAQTTILIPAGGRTLYLANNAAGTGGTYFLTQETLEAGANITLTPTATGLRIDGAGGSGGGGGSVDSVAALAPLKTSAATGPITLTHLLSGVAAGTYSKVTVDTYGHVTVGAQLTSADIAAIYTETDPVYVSNKPFIMIQVVGSIPASTNLNSYTQTGMYYQQADASAASGTNYPVARAGVLSVWNSNNNGLFIYQHYHTQGSFNTLYIRTYYNSVWSAWKEVSTMDTITLQAVANAGNTTNSMLSVWGTLKAPTVGTSIAMYYNGGGYLAARDWTNANYVPLYLQGGNSTAANTLLISDKAYYNNNPIWYTGSPDATLANVLLNGNTGMKDIILGDYASATSAGFYSRRLLNSKGMGSYLVTGSTSTNTGLFIGIQDQSDATKNKSLSILDNYAYPTWILQGDTTLYEVYTSKGRPYILYQPYDHIGNDVNVLADAMRGNTVTFAYTNGTYNSGVPITGTLLTVGGKNGNYPLQISAGYGSSVFYFRTLNSDTGTWNPWKQMATTDAIPLSTVLAVGNQADYGITLGSAGNSASNSLTLNRLFLTYAYQAIMAITGGDATNSGLTLISTGQGAGKEMAMVLPPGQTAPLVSVDTRATWRALAFDTPIILPTAAHDLNSYTAAGVYHQSANTGAAAGTNYPVAMAGWLTVHYVSGGNFVYQMYQSYQGDNKIYYRTYYGAWSPWRELATTAGNTLQATTTAGNTTGDIIQITGTNKTPSGSGLELAYAAGAGSVRAFNRASGVNLPTLIYGGTTNTTHQLQVSDTITFDSKPVWYDGAPTLSSGNSIQVTATSGQDASTFTGIQLYWDTTNVKGMIRSLYRGGSSSNITTYPLALSGGAGTDSNTATLTIGQEPTFSNIKGNNLQMWYQNGPNDTNSFIRTTGNANVPASGPGAELSYQGSTAYLIGFNRTGNLYIPTTVRGGNNSATAFVSLALTNQALFTGGLFQIGSGDATGQSVAQAILSICNQTTAGANVLAHGFRTNHSVASGASTYAQGLLHYMDVSTPSGTNNGTISIYGYTEHNATGGTTTRVVNFQASGNLIAGTAVNWYQYYSAGIGTTVGVTGNFVQFYADTQTLTVGGTKYSFYAGNNAGIALFNDGLTVLNQIYSRTTSTDATNMPNPQNFLGIATGDASANPVVSAIFRTNQAVATTGSAQGVEGYVKNSHTSGTVALAIGVVSSIEINGTGGTTTTVHSTRSGGTLTAGTVGNWVQYYSAPVTAGGTVSGNFFGFHADQQTVTVTGTKYSFYGQANAGIAFIADGITTQSDLAGGHIKGYGSTPGIAIGAGLTGTVSIVGTDVSGFITLNITTATAPTGGHLFTVTYARAFTGQYPFVNMSPVGQVTVSNITKLCVGNMNVNNFTIMGAPAVSIPVGTYNFTYCVFQ